MPRPRVTTTTAPQPPGGDLTPFQLAALEDFQSRSGKNETYETEEDIAELMAVLEHLRDAGC